MATLGYYYANAKWGNFYKQVRRFAPIYRTSVLDFKTSETSLKKAFQRFESALDDAAKHKKTRIVLALD